MPIALSTLRSPTLILNKPIQFSSHSPLSNRAHANLKPPFGSNESRTSISRLREPHKFHRILSKNLGFSVTRNHGFLAKAENVGEGTGNLPDEAEMEARGESSMPERFRHLMKEAPDKPTRWPFLIVLAFLLYTWRTVLWELSNWGRVITPFFRFIGYIPKLVVAIFFRFVMAPITPSIRFFETTLYNIHGFHSWVINYAPIEELTKSIILASLILAIAEAAVPDSVNRQSYSLTVAGFVGFVAINGYISELFFWILLLGLFSFGRWIKKRDYVSSSLPVAAVLTAVGEPWIRMIVMVSYLSLAIVEHSKEPANEKVEDKAAIKVRRVPFSLLCAALAIGVRLAAKWAGYRHLTWKIV